jgi:hypothetical protein
MRARCPCLGESSLLFLSGRSADLTAAHSSPPGLTTSASSSSSSSVLSTPPGIESPSPPAILSASVPRHEHSARSAATAHAKHPSAGSLSYVSIPPDQQPAPPPPTTRLSRASDAHAPPPPSLPDTSSLMSGAMPVVMDAYRRPDPRGAAAAASSTWRPKPREPPPPGPASGTRAEPPASRFRTAEPSLRTRALDPAARSHYAPSAATSASGSGPGFQVLSRPARGSHLTVPQTKSNAAPSMHSNHSAASQNRDRVDALDDTDPLGYGWHHSSPYEAVGASLGRGPRSDAASTYLNAPVRSTRVRDIVHTLTTAPQPAIPAVHSHRVSPTRRPQETITPIDPRPPPSAAMFPSAANPDYLHPEDTHDAFDPYGEPAPPEPEPELEAEPPLYVPPPGARMPAAPLTAYEGKRLLRERERERERAPAAPVLPAGPSGSYTAAAHARRSPPAAPSVRSVGGDSGYSTPVTFRSTGSGSGASVRSRSTVTSGPPPSHRPKKLVMPTPLQGAQQPLQVIRPPLAPVPVPVASSSRSSSRDAAARAAHVPMLHDRGHNLLRKSDRLSRSDHGHGRGSIEHDYAYAAPSEARERSASRERGLLRRASGLRDRSPAPGQTTGSFTSWFVTPKTKEVEPVAAAPAPVPASIGGGGGGGGRKKLSKRH